MTVASFRSVLRFIGRNGKRAGVAVAGFTLIAVGLVMLVAPGPGLLVIVAGLAVLATEFAWAERALDQAKRKAKEAAARARRAARRGPKPEPGSVDADPRGDDPQDG